MNVASSILVGMILLTGNDWEIAPSSLKWIILSGIIGIGFGDLFLFIVMERLGPRRTGILFALNASLAALLAWLLLDEALTFMIIFALIFGFFGIVLAVIYGDPKTNVREWELTEPPLWLVAGAGLLAAFGQVDGVLILRPIMEQGTDPLQVTFIRVLAAGVFLWSIIFFEKNKTKIWKIPPADICRHIAGNGFFGPSFGLFLFLKALETGQVAKVSMLVAISPVLMFPFICFQAKKIPALGA